MFRLIVLCFAMLAAGLDGADASPVDNLRVYAIEPASFDYVFTAIVSSSGTHPVLSFNHRSGKTLFIHPGERMGDYVVTNYQPVVTNVFNTTIKMVQEKKGGAVTLCGTNGLVVTLELGKRVQQPGWMAYLVDLSNGNWWYVREWDRVGWGSVSMEIGPVASNSVVLYAAEYTNRVSIITESESTKLAALWASSARSRKQKPQEADAETAQDETVFDPVPQVQPQPVPRHPVQSVVMQYPSRTFFGTEYSCPTEYMVLPAIWNSNGKLVRPTMIVPRRFGTRSAGFSIETR